MIKKYKPIIKEAERVGGFYCSCTCPYFERAPYAFCKLFRKFLYSSNLSSQINTLVTDDCFKVYGK